MIPVSAESLAVDLRELDVSLFESTESMKVWCGSYNVNGKKEQALNLSHWLKQGWADVGGSTPDIWVIGLQEMIDLSASNVLKDAVADTVSRTQCEEWVKEMHRAFEYVSASKVGCFAPGSLPVLVGKEYMCGIALLVYVSNKKREESTSGGRPMSYPPKAGEPKRVSTKGVATARIPTGAVGGRLGNKGACAVRLRVESTDICFVAAHLSAHRSDVESRNADYDVIVRKDCFKRDRFGATSGIVSSWTAGDNIDPSGTGSAASFAAFDSAPASTTQDSPNHNMSSTSLSSSMSSSSLALTKDDSLTEYFTVLDHDVVLFFGDLNYRIVKSTPDKEVAYLIKADLPKLLGLDQLVNEKRYGRVFQHGFYEPPIKFAPTYKYAAGTTFYDHEAYSEGERNGSGKKIRCPAWCDRVLYRVRPRGPRADGFSEKVTCVAYDRASDRLCVSDHRPVFALLDLQIRRVDLEKRALACARLADRRRVVTPLIDTDFFEDEHLQRVSSASSDTLVASKGHQLFGGGAPPPTLAPPQLPMRRAGSAPAIAPRPKAPRLPLDPPLILLRAGQPCDLTLQGPDTSGGDNDDPRASAFAFAQLPPWLRLDPCVGSAMPTAQVRASASLDPQTLNQLHDSALGGKLGATVKLILGSRTFLVPVCVTASPTWPALDDGIPTITNKGPPALPARRPTSANATNLPPFVA